MVHIDASELRDLADDLGDAIARTPRRVASAMAATAHDIEVDARRLAPVNTGALRSSIGSDIDGLSVDVGASARYAQYVEEGTSDTAPQPFMRPAFDRNLPGLERALAESGSDVL